MPMTGKNLWRLCKTYGRQIGYPQLKPHDLRHGVAMEVYEAARRSRASARTARSRAHRHDTGVRADPAGAPQAGRGVLRGKGARRADEMNGTFNSVFE